jgi:hypothetical protein
MRTHTLFYYPYGSFYDEQMPLLRTAALYFDKFYILDPTKASFGTIGIPKEGIGRDIQLLEQQGILEKVSPEDVLHDYEQAIANAVRADLGDPEFVRLCHESGRADRWTLALAKVPRQIRDDPRFKPLDRTMQRIMGDLPRQVMSHVATYDEQYAEVAQAYLEGDFVYDETREIEYRYADYPLPLGESIMVNHALFGGLLQRGATPITQDPFHNQVLNLKIRRIRDLPQVKNTLEDRAKQRQLTHHQLAVTALTDIDLEIISPKVPLEEILTYRNEHHGELQAARRELANLARQIRETPWSAEFAGTLEHDIIPNRIYPMLEACKKTREAWLKKGRVGKILKILGLTAATAGATVSLVTNPNPLLSIPVITGFLGLVGENLIPGAEAALDWLHGKKEAQENGLHYLIRFRD